MRSNSDVNFVCCRKGLMQTWRNSEPFTNNSELIVVSTSTPYGILSRDHESSASFVLHSFRPGHNLQKLVNLYVHFFVCFRLMHR